jgi:hypothetical protein
MTDEDRCYLSAKAALDLFNAREVSPVEILKAQIARSDEFNPDINCFADRYFEDALQQARTAETVYAQRSGAPRPLGQSFPTKEVGLDRTRPPREEIRDLHSVSSHCPTGNSAKGVKGDLW